MAKLPCLNDLTGLPATRLPVAFISICVFSFVVSLAATFYFCRTMNDGMNMAGDWTMSMMWMRMPGQTWSGAVAMFLGMWIVMMVAMMMPSLVPALFRHHRDFVTRRSAHPGWLTLLIGAGYFFVWTLFGLLIFPFGMILSSIEMKLPALAREVPLAAGVVVFVSGTLQFTEWKSRQLACCREAPYCGRTGSANAATALKQGMRFGFHCSQCCFGLMMILVVIGIMDLRAMSVVTICITAERLVPFGNRAAKAIGALAIGTGLFLVAQTIGPLHHIL